MYFNQAAVSLHQEPDNSSPSVSYGLYGEKIKILSQENDFIYIESVLDSYKGYVSKECLSDFPNFNPSHYVSRGSTLLFKQADIKSSLPEIRYFGTPLMIVSDKLINDRFYALSTGGYILKDHITPIGQPVTKDYVALAEKFFLQTPYLWGGRTAHGIDCSGLVQICLMGVGHYVPRDSSDQETFFSDKKEPLSYHRGDIVFWKGHVGMMVDDRHLIHANATHMACIIEPLEDVIERNKDPIRKVIRL